MKHRAFDLLGNIAILNFPREIKQKQKKKFAEQLLKKNKVIKTVLEKCGKVKGRLRKITTKYLAGEKTKEVLYRENNCVFRFNIDTTYFSPRLSNERKEIASLIKKDESVLVMFAGVAPFSIVIAKLAGVKVVSNEINRIANKYGRLNAELNNLKFRIEFWDGDIKKITKKILSSQAPTPRPPFPNVHSPKARDIGINDNVKQTRNYYNRTINFRATLERDNLNILRYFDVIVMPRPQLKDSFLEQAFAFSKKGTRIFYYDFCKVGEEKQIAEKIKSEAKKFKKKIKILKIKKAGEIAPYKIRVRVDFKVI